MPSKAIEVHLGQSNIPGMEIGGTHLNPSSLNGRTRGGEENAPERKTWTNQLPDIFSAKLFKFANEKEVNLYSFSVMDLIIL